MLAALLAVIVAVEQASSPTPAALQYTAPSTVFGPGGQMRNYWVPPFRVADSPSIAESLADSAGSDPVTMVRYTFYYSKNWIRADNLDTHISYISKCSEHQHITLYLTSKLYTINETSTRECAMPPMNSLLGRGKVESLSESQADPLFEIPQGYTEER